MLRERNSDIASFMEYPIYNIFKMYTVLILVVLFWFASIYPNCMRKTHLFWNFWVLRERSRDICSLVDHPAYSIFKIHSVLILEFLFWFVATYPKCIVKVIYFRNIRCSTEEAAMLLLLWSILCIAFSKHKAPWFLIAYFYLLLATHIPDENIFLPGNFRCSTEKAAILLLAWSTLYITFSK